MENVPSMLQQKPNNEELEKTLAELAEVESALSMLKPLYERKDNLTLKLKELIGTDTEVAVGDLIFTVVDNFSGKNVVFRNAAVRRFELDVDSKLAREIKAQKEAEKAAKKATKAAKE